MGEKYYTIPEVAEMLKVTPAAIRKWIAQGRIDVVYVGADRRITEKAIEEFVQKSTAARKSKLDRGGSSEVQSSGIRTPGHAATALGSA